MKKISDELCNEIREMLSDAQFQSGLAYDAAKAGDVRRSERYSIGARELILRAMNHLDSCVENE